MTDSESMLRKRSQGNGGYETYSPFLLTASFRIPAKLIVINS